MRGSDGASHEIEVIIGTQQGETIDALNQKDPAAWWGDKGLIPLLQTKKGIKIWPPNASEEEHIRYWMEDIQFRHIVKSTG